MAVYEDFTGTYGATPTTGSGSMGTAVSLTAPVRDICGIRLEFGFGASGASSSSARPYMFTLLDNTTPILPTLFVRPATSGRLEITIPGFFIPAGTALKLQGQSNSANTNVSVRVMGKNKEPGEKALYVRGESIAVDTTNTRAGTTTVTTDGAWDQIVASAARDYKALIPMVSTAAVDPTTSQWVRCDIGIGAAASEITIGPGFATRTLTGDPRVSSNLGGVIRCDIPATTPISGKAIGATTTDTLAMGLIGLY